MDENSAMALLTRVIQRIHLAGLLLHAPPEDGGFLPDAERALDELEKALVDIRVTVLSWEIAPMAIGRGQWSRTVPSWPSAQPGLCAISQGWPSGSTKTPE